MRTRKYRNSMCLYLDVADNVRDAFDWPYSVFRNRNTHVCFEKITPTRILMLSENKKRISASFPVKMLEICLPKYSFKEKYGGYSVYLLRKIVA